MKYPPKADESAPTNARIIALICLNALEWDRLSIADMAVENKAKSE